MNRMIDNQTVANCLGLETEAYAVHRKKTTNNNSLAFEAEELDTLVSTLKGSIGKYNDGGVSEHRAIGEANLQHIGIAKHVNRLIGSENAYALLPKGVKNLVSPVYKTYRKELQSVQTAGNENERGKANYRLGLAKSALTKSLTSIFSSALTLDRARFSNPLGVESENAYKMAGRMFEQGYKASDHKAPIYDQVGNESAVAEVSDAILIPKMAVILDWFNVASTIYRKVQETKTLANEICQIPIQAAKQVFEELDTQGNVVKTWKREELFAKMNMEEVAPNLASLRTRTVEWGKTEFNREINLYRDTIASLSAPLLKRDENINHQIRIIGYSTNTGLEGAEDVPVDKEIHDTQAGWMKGPALHELDTKGKILTVTPDPAKPNEQYIIAVNFNVQDKTLRIVTPVKTSQTMPDIVSFKLVFAMRDIQQSLKSRVTPRIKNVRTVLDVPLLDRQVLIINSDENAFIDERGTANYLQKQVALLNELTANKKESFWYGKYKDMAKEAKSLSVKADGSRDTTVLYTEKKMDLKVGELINKREGIDIFLGKTFGSIKDTLAKNSNSHSDVQLNMFTGTLSLRTISQCLESVTGEVNESSNGNFLGVTQKDRVNAITFGEKSTAPIQAIIVGSDKDDLVAKGKTPEGAIIPNAEIEYDFHVLPYFKDANIHTTVFTEIPSRVISGSEIRANENILLPSMIIHEAYNYSVIRDAAAKITLFGDVGRFVD